MGGCDHRTAAEDARQHAVGVGAAHVRVQHLRVEGIDLARHADELGRRAPERGRKQLDAIEARLLRDPGVRPVHQHDPVPAPGQEAHQQQAVHDRTVDPGAGDQHGNAERIGYARGHGSRI
jgi:hypothetical protein